MSEMVERVARAMQQRAKERLGNIQSLERFQVGSLGDAWPYLVRAAIEAMREPTEEMQKAGYDCIPDGAGVKPIWQAMIDEALR